MRRINIVFLIIGLVCFNLAVYPADDYKTPAELNQALVKLGLEHGKTITLKKIGVSAGGSEILAVEIVKDKNNPAVLLVANMEGDSPVATFAAVKTIEKLLTDWKADLDEVSFYVIPLANPDGYLGFFDKPLYESFLNKKKINDDLDERTDEDGPDDLNKDGIITIMRQKHPDGTWMLVEGNPVLMKKADTAKGEKGIYRIFPEGLDNDGDGEINEDGPGGTNPGHNFPHEFKNYTKTDGPWPASESESRAVLEYAYSHPEIAMVLSYSRINTLIKLPPTDKKSEAGKDKYKVPERMAKSFGLDPEKEYPIKELVEMAREFTGYKELSEDMVLMFLGVGAVVNPNRNDVKYWEEISTKYKDYLKEAGLDGKRLDSKEIPNGTFEEWAYFQFGVYTFAMDFWTVPVKEEKKAEDGLSADEIEKMTNEEFIALGKDRIQAFIDKSGRKGFNADMVINALKSGMLSTTKIAEMMRKMQKSESSEGVDASEKALFDFNPDAFVKWTSYKHPTLGEVEIGGIKPYAFINPPVDKRDELVDKQIPFVRKLVGLLPKLNIARVEITEAGKDVWRVKAWIVNDGFLPVPSHHATRCKAPVPVVAKLVGKEFKVIEGKERQPLPLIEGSGSDLELNWLISGDEGTVLKLKIEAPSIRDTEKSFALQAGGAK
ncbi:MAG: hypothetical protein JW737_08810 [Acidobacteria bacterium]|nr:hypothetical protein [Acidobacteriota bacterium]